MVFRARAGNIGSGKRGRGNDLRVVRGSEGKGREGKRRMYFLLVFAVLWKIEVVDLASF